MGHLLLNITFMIQNTKTHTTFKTIGTTVAAIFFMALVFVPTNAYAFQLGQIIDPFCLFACSKPQKVTKTYTYTNSNNVASNINSPGATVQTGGTPVAYNYPPTYYPPQPTYSPLQVSCYPTPSTADQGQTVYWYTNVTGGNGSYSFYWSGSDGLSGSGSSVSRTYYSPGTKNASVTVHSDGQTISQSCNGNVYIRDDGYNYNYNNNNYYNYNNNYQNNNYPITVSCSPNVSTTNVGTVVYWTAYVSGGSYNGYNTYNNYSISWSGTDGISGSGQSTNYTYNTPGQKYAIVSVYANGQQTTQYCSSSVNVVGYAYNNYVAPVYPAYINGNTNLDVGCIADPATARINQPVTWKTEVVGGFAPYAYSWTGSDDLSGSDSSVTKYYSTAGSKNAIVTVKSSDGRTATHACSNSATIRSTATVAPKPATTPTVQPETKSADGGLSAAALFSLKNVPWGWVAILIILVLFATVVYLIYNRPKI